MRLPSSLTAGDPGSARLRKAARGAVAMLMAGLTVAGLREFAGLGSTVPAAAEVSAGFLALWATVGAVKDSSAKARLVTTVALVPSGLLAAAAVCLLHPEPVARAAGFVVVAGLAAWFASLGPRGSACGFFAFITYFFGVVMNAGQDDLPLLAGLVLLAVTIAVVVRLILIRDRPATEIARLLDSVLRTADDLIGASVKPDVEPDRMARAVSRVGAAVHAVIRWQDTYATVRYVDADAVALTDRVLAVQLSCEQAAYAVAATDRNDAIRAAVMNLRQAIGDVGRDGGESSPHRAGRAGTAFGAIELATRAATGLNAVEIRARPLDAEHGAAEPDRRHPGDRESARVRIFSHDAARFAVQVMAASSVAVVVGELISASRWYWAVLSAFMVFNGMATRGAVLTKAVKRVQGTVTGLVVGVGAALLVGHHPPVQYGIVVAAIFLAYYLGPVSYTWTVLFITVVLTTTYDLLGVLDRQVLEWRIEETLAGAVVGTAATFVVLSTPSNPALIVTLRAYFDALVDVAATAVGPTARAADLALSTARLDAAEMAVFEATSATSISLSRQHRSMVRSYGPFLRAATREAHGLVWSVRAEHRGDATAEADAVVASGADGVERLRDYAGKALSSISSGRPAQGSGAEEDVVSRSLTPAAPDPSAQVERIAAAVLAMAQIDGRTTNVGDCNGRVDGVPDTG